MKFWGLSFWQGSSTVPLVDFLAIQGSGLEQGGGTHKITHEEAQAGARFATRVFRLWGLTDAQACVLLGELSPRTYARWKRGEIGTIDADRRMRLSLIAGIHKALRYLFSDKARAYRWFKTPNLDFNGEPPLELALRGGMVHLMEIRAYLDAARGW